MFTRTQCCIYQFEGIDSPIIFYIEEIVSFIFMASNTFASIGESGVSVYNYEGKKLASLRFQGLSIEKVLEGTVTLSNDTLAIVDNSDKRVSP